jgi:uncharacterized protein YcaQ
MIVDLDLKTARRMAADAAGLCPVTGGLFGSRADGAEAAIAHLSSVQIDTISVVERAHHHILWSRVPTYKPRHLDLLEAEPCRVIEYWSHAAAYLPVADFRYCLPRMERIRRQGHEWFKADKATVRRVRERIKAEGPLRVQDFEGPKRKGAGWWDWKPAKVALEYLFHAGELVSVGREGFQKRYDLAERALPQGLDLRRPDEAAMAAWYVDTASRALGVFSAIDVAYGRKDLTGGTDKEIAHRVESGSLVEVEVAGLERPKAWYAAPAALEAAASPEAGRARAFILSPFDPLIIDRRRLRRLFGFDYQLECYLPEAKRRFGYFTLPILFRDSSGEASFAGLLDAKAERDTGILTLRRLALSGIAPKARSSFAAALVAELRRFAAFNGCADTALVRLEADDSRLENLVRERLGRAD